MFDAHTHLDRLEPQIGEVNFAKRMEDWRSQGLQGGIVAGVSPRSAPGQAAFCERWPTFAWTIGLHPWELGEGWTPETRDQLQALETWSFVADGGPVGIGETGLDRPRAERLGGGSWQLQCEVFRSQLRIADRLGLPLVLHVVGAHGAAQSEVRQFRGLRGMVHDFGGSLEEGLAWWRLGFLISIREKGPLSPKRRRVLEGIPLEALLVESDLDEGATEKRIQAGLWPAIAELCGVRGLDGTRFGEEASIRARGLFGLACPRG